LIWRSRRTREEPEDVV